MCKVGEHTTVKRVSHMQSSNIWNKNILHIQIFNYTYVKKNLLSYIQSFCVKSKNMTTNDFHDIRIFYFQSKCRLRGRLLLTGSGLSPLPGAGKSHFAISPSNEELTSIG